MVVNPPYAHVQTQRYWVSASGILQTVNRKQTLHNEEITKTKIEVCKFECHSSLHFNSDVSYVAPMGNSIIFIINIILLLHCSVITTCV